MSIVAMAIVGIAIAGIIIVPVQWYAERGHAE
jgi:hypothetical protein